MEDAIEKEKDPQDLILRILSVNFAAIHTTSMVSLFFLTYPARVNFPVKAFTFALYQLLAQ
jgi:hypothetical protein